MKRNSFTKTTKKMKKVFLFFILMVCFFQTDLHAQVSLEKQNTQKLYKRAFNMQFGGATGWYSVNYERFFRNKSAPGYYLLFGIGYSEISYKYVKWIDFPIKFKVGKEFGRFKAEIGLSKLLA
jgi:hypothetical protein